MSKPNQIGGGLCFAIYFLIGFSASMWLYWNNIAFSKAYGASAEHYAQDIFFSVIISLLVGLIWPVYVVVGALMWVGWHAVLLPIGGMMAN